MRLLVDNFISSNAGLGSPGLDEIRWLKPLRPDMRLKPDLFVAPRVCVKERAGTNKQGSVDCFLFGGLAHPRLQSDGCVRLLFEGKLDPLTLAHLGELDVQVLEDLGGNPLALADEAEEQVLRADIRVVEPTRLIDGELAG